MKKKKNTACLKRVTESKEEMYLVKIFDIIKAKNRIVFHDGEMNFNDTELRLISEIVSATYEGKRLISTQLADALGITRSAVSQIVNRLEERGVVQRVADDIDKKIAYIIIAEDILDTYGEDLKNCYEFLHKAIGSFGEERFFRMCDDFEQFIGAINETMVKMREES